MQAEIKWLFLPPYIATTSSEHIKELIKTYRKPAVKMQKYMIFYAQLQHATE